MPPKKNAKGKGPAGPVLPPLNTNPWKGEDVDVNLDDEAVVAYEPTGKLLQDVLSYSLLFRIPPHPGLLKRKPQPEEDESAAPAAVSEPPPVEELFELEAPTDSFSLRGWSIDTGSWIALRLSLKVCTELTSLSFNSCGLTPRQIADVAALALELPALTSICIEWNPLRSPPVEDDEIAATSEAETKASDDDDDEEAQGEEGEQQVDETGEDGEGEEVKEGGEDAEGETEAKEDVPEGKDVSEEAKTEAVGDSGTTRSDSKLEEGEGEGDGAAGEEVPTETNTQQEEAAVPAPTPRDPSPFASLIHADSPVKFLGLRGNALNTDDAYDIGKNLHLNRTLETLSLGSNNISDAGVAALCSFLRDNRTLLNLSLFRNQLTAESAKTLTQSLTIYSLTSEEAAARKVLELELFGEPPAEPETPPEPVKGKKGKGAPVEAATHPSLPLLRESSTLPGTWRGIGNFNLRTLDLTDNWLGDAGITALLDLAPSGAPTPHATVRETSRGSSRKKSSRGSARGKAASGAGAGGAPTGSPDELWAAGPLNHPIRSGLKLLAVSLNRASEEVLTRTAEALVNATKGPGDAEEDQPMVLKV